MDWIEDIWVGVKKKLYNVSLRKAMLIYMSAAILSVVFLSLLTTTICGGWENVINSHYYENVGGMVSLRNLHVAEEDMTEKDQFLMNIISAIRNFNIFFYSIGAMVVTSSLFYKDKFKEPMGILMKEAAHVSRGELDFECSYESRDEMGELCSAFNAMRLQLIENYEKNWELMEEQRRLNAAFAHDLRTPLTVLRGYTDFLARYYPEGKVSEKQLIENLNLMGAQVIRLMEFGDTMKAVTSMEELEPKKKDTTLRELEKKIQDLAQIMDGTKGISISYRSYLMEDRNWVMDDALVMEVMENAVSNALRYASSKIEIGLDESEDGKYLELYVQDDGPGFTKEGLKQAARPYYKDKTRAEGNHFGIGLFICKLLCEKHGGALSLSNSIDGGAIVEASFFAV